MSGKKGKKTKGKTVPLQDFLGATPGGSLPTIPKTKSWADDADDDDFTYSSRNKDPVVLPTAPRAARDQSINEENIPTSPPFVAYISNLPYDVDEEDLNEFFQDMKISSMRLPKDANKVKGYGYVEFEDRQSLIDALTMIDTNLKNRRVRIEVSNSSNDERRGRMGRMGEQRRDYSDDPERTTGDWRSARANDDGPADEGREDRYRSRGGFDRNRDENRDSGFEDNKPGGWRDGPRDTSSMDRPRPSYRDNRGGPGGDDRGGERDWNRFADRGRGGGGGGGGFRDGSRERDGGDRGERGGGSSFGPRRHYGDDMDRDKERWGSVRNQPREPVGDGPPRDTSDGPRTRPKLNLQPRSKPVEQAAAVPKEETDGASDDSERPAPAAAAPVPAANIFGAAKPVDTAAREREIEERLAKSAEARSKEEPDAAKLGGAPREGVWNRRNGEGRDNSERSRPAWRSNEDRGNFDRSGGRQPMSRLDQRDQRDYRDQRDSRRPREMREPIEPTGNSQEPRGDSRGPPMNRGVAPPPARGPPKQIDSRPPPDGAEREKKREDKDDEEGEISRMPKAKEDQAPNFAASNKYSMLPDDVDPDNIEE